MRPRNGSNPGDGGVPDSATLYLCRQGPRWVVVIESPRISGALRFDYSGRDSYDARFELLSLAFRACPGADISCPDGALEGADYEWRLEVRGLAAGTGDLGIALHRALAAHPPAHVSCPSQRRIAHCCPRELSPFASSRPRDF